MAVERSNQLPLAVAQKPGFWGGEVRGRIMPDTVSVGEDSNGGGFLVQVTSLAPDGRTVKTRDARASTAGAAIKQFNERPDMRDGGFTVALRVDPNGKSIEGSYCIVEREQQPRRAAQ